MKGGQVIGTLKFLTQRALHSEEMIDFADKHAGVMVMSKQI
jgi:hypothetical protein